VIWRVHGQKQSTANRKHTLADYRTLYEHMPGQVTDTGILSQEFKNAKSQRQKMILGKVADYRMLSQDLKNAKA